MTEQPAQTPAREPAAVRRARHMQERADSDAARRAARGLPPKGPADHASTCLIFGILAVAVGLIGPQIPGYLTSVSGVRYSVAGYHAVCTSGLGELAQAGHRGIAADCSQAALLMTLGWVAVGAGALLLLAAVLLWTRGRPAA
jgi:hypothetical protein